MHTISCKEGGSVVVACCVSMSVSAQHITSAVLSAAKAAAAQCPTTIGDASSTSAPSCGGATSWSTHSAEIESASLIHIHCTHVALGVQHLVRSDACCVAHRVATALVDAVTSVGTPTEQQAFWSTLLGSGSTSHRHNPSTLVPVLLQHITSSCATGAETIQESEMRDILFAADSSSTCDDLAFVVNNCSSSVTCLLTQVARAQAQVWPSSRVPRGTATAGSTPSVLSVAAPYLLVLGIVVVVATLCALLARWWRHRRLHREDAQGRALNITTVWSHPPAAWVP